MKKKHNIKRINKLKRVLNFLNDISWAFELNNFERTIIEKESQPSEHPDLAAEVTTDTVYKEITIGLYPRFWELSLDLQRKALLHELTHTLLQDTRKLSEDLLNGILHCEKEITEANERAVTSVTYLLDCLLRKHLKYMTCAYRDYLKK